MENTREGTGSGRKARSLFDEHTEDKFVLKEEQQTWKNEVQLADRKENHT